MNSQTDLIDVVLKSPTSNKMLSVTSIENNIPMELTYYKSQIDKNIYSILEKKDVINELIKIKKVVLFLPLKNILCISLSDFPIGQYTLSVNGINIISSVNNVFHFTKISQKWKDAIFLGVFGNISEICISHSNSIKLNTLHKINVQLNLIGNKTFDIYPYNTWELCCNHVTESFDIKTDVPFGTILVRFHGETIHEIITTNETMRINLKGHNGHDDKQYSHLPSNIKEMTVNLSCMFQNIQLVVLNCKIISIYQNKYSTYSYPERTNIFMS